MEVIKTKENPMGTRPVFPLLLSMSLPPMVSMLIQSMYNIVDSVYLANYSQDALAAVSLAFPLQNLVLAVAVGFGIGINSCIARSLGEKNERETMLAASHGVVCTALHSLFFVFVGLFLTGPFIGMFTDNADVLSMGTAYSRIVICMAFGCLFHILIEKIFQATGNMVVPMILQAVGAFINIILDPILIFGYLGFPRMGVTGAAVATIIGQLVACALAVFMFIRQDVGVSVNLKGFRFDKRVLKKLYSISIPAGAMAALPSVMVGLLNGILSGFSQTAVAVLGAYMKLQSFVYMPANGVVQGLRPIVGYCYGAGSYDRIHKAIRAALVTIGAIMAGGTLLFLGLPELIMTMFHAEGEMMVMGVTALRIISLGFLISTVSLVISGTFEGIGNGVASLAINLIRQFLITPPLAIVLSKSMGISGVWMAFPVAEALACVAAIFLFMKSKVRRKA